MFRPTQAVRLFIISIVCRTAIPVIRCLHQKINANTHRYGKYVHIHFKEFKDAIDSDPTWKQFLMDGGVGQPPLKYLVLVEKGLRNFGQDLHAMGSGACIQFSRQVEKRSSLEEEGGLHRGGSIHIGKTILPPMGLLQVARLHGAQKVW